MGQRLNVEILDNGKLLANAYYHWGAYTCASLEVAQQIIDAVDIYTYEDKVVSAIKMLELTGAGLTDEEVEFAKKKLNDYNAYCFIACTGRNDGLIAISEQGMEMTRQWEEGRVGIDISNKTVNFNVFYEIEEDDFDEHELELIPTHDIKFNALSFSEFLSLKTLIQALVEQWTYTIRLKSDNKILGFVE